jgi:hypothetical protein
MNQDQSSQARHPEGKRQEKSLEGREVYNMVTDLGTGLNFRFRDNLFQAVAILVCLIVGIGIGFVLPVEMPMGPVLGGVGGLLVGLFGSGIFLMIYRSIRHFRGKHE